MIFYGLLFFLNLKQKQQVEETLSSISTLSNEINSLEDK